MDIFLSTLETDIGTVVVRATGSAVTSIGFLEEGETVEPTPEIPAVLLTCITQLQEYFEGKRKDFAELPLAIRGTDFQMKVWDGALEIPYGTTDTYGGLAGKIGDAKASRAVGTALGRNAIAIVIPCHRILSSGDGGGYAWGNWRKEWLLQLESRA